MLDALCPARDCLQTYAEDEEHAKTSILTVDEVIDMVAKAANAGAESTRFMPARAGRASYVCANRLTEPDAGAVAVSIWIAALGE